MKKFNLFFFLVLVVFCTGTVYSQNVTVNPGAGSYATLKDAFDAINAGTHTGAITVSIDNNTTEIAPAVLNSSGAGSASYTSINIYPSGDNITVSSTTPQGRGVIELKGADNVTIDGDNPNTAGTNRNLTITNTAAATVTYASVIRICMTASVVASADNNTIKNCILNGNATGRNLNTATSTTGSENTTFGIVTSNNGGTTATDSPTAMTSVTGAAPSGTTINALVIQNNTVNQCARGIAFMGAAATNSTGVTITGNVVGDQGSVTDPPPYTTPTTTVYTKGIYVQGTTAITITNNTVKNIISYVGTPVNGIELNSVIGTGGVLISGNTVSNISQNSTAANIPTGIIVSNAGGVAYTVQDNSVSNVRMLGTTSCAGITGAVTLGTFQRNKIFNIINDNTATYGSYGLNITGGNTQTIQNNLIYNVYNNQVAGTGSYSTTFGAFGIRLATGTGHKVYYNTVNLYGAIPGVTNTDMVACIAIVTAASTGMDIRNNIFANTMTGGNTAASGTRFASVYMVTGATVSMNLTINNNILWGSADANSRLALVGTTAGSGEYTAANFDPTQITPSTNFRAYTSPLSAAGTNDNASKKTDPIFPSNTNLQITDFGSSAYNAGTPIATILTDYLQVTRSATTPTIGAYELSLPATPNDAGVTAVTRNPSGIVLVGAPVDFYAKVKNFGTNAQSGIPVYYRVVGGSTTGPIATTGTMNQNDTQTVHFEGANVFNPGVSGTYTLKFYTQLAGDTTYQNDTTTMVINVQEAIYDAGISLASSTKLTAGLAIVGAQYNFRAVARNYGTLSLASPVDVYYTDNGGAPVGPLSATITNPGDTQSVFFPTYSIPSAVVHTIKFYTHSSPSDNSAANDTQTVVIDATQITSYPYFEKANVGTVWTVLLENVVGTNALWGLGIDVGPSGVADTGFTANFFNGSALRREILRSPVLDFTSVAKPVMSFSAAYRGYTGTEDDSLEVLYSTDGGLTFISQADIYNKSKYSTPSLATRYGTNTSFFPDSASQWRHEIVEFPELGGLNSIVIGFRAKSQFGNRCWVDNIQIFNANGNLTSCPVTATGNYTCAPNVAINFTALARPNSGTVTPNDKASNGPGKSDGYISKFGILQSVEGSGITRIQNQTVDHNPAGGVLKISDVQNSYPPSSAPVWIATNAAATSGDGTVTQPSGIYQYHWYTITYSGNDYTGNATYDISLDLTSYASQFLDMGKLYIMKRADQTASWVAQNTTRAGNILTVSGLNSFSDFAIGGDTLLNPLPVELTTFAASVSVRNVELTWTTSSEMNNSGFDIERKLSTSAVWNKIAFAEGHGTSNIANSYNYQDRNLTTGKYNYRLKQIDFNGNYKYYQLSNLVEVGVPTKFDLSQNYPNPFNPTTKINYDLPFDSKVSIKLFDMTGREIATIINSAQTAGYYTVQFNGANLASGVYFYNIIAEGGNNAKFISTKKMVLVK